MNSDRAKEMSLDTSLVLLFLIASLFSACGIPADPAKETPEQYGYSLNPALFDLGDRSRVDFLVKSVVGSDVLVVQYEKLERESGVSAGNFYAVSRDRGSSFETETPITAMIPNEAPFTSIAFLPDFEELSAIGFRERNIFFTQFGLRDRAWSASSQISDEQNSVSGSVSCTERKPEIFCIWLDSRRGFPLIFFSASADDGRTWSQNRPIEHDFREGNQTAPALIAGADNRLLVCWEDWRDRRTLVDIRCSYSDDGGKHWSSSVRINDDREHVWQHNFSIAGHNGKIFVAFQDFRDPGEEGDNDWNIYLARSEDNGTTWQANSRLNDVAEGSDFSPRLAIDESGDLVCVWWTGRNSILGQIAASHSSDGGRSWSRSTLLTDPSERFSELSRSVIPFQENKFLIGRVKAGKPIFEYLERSAAGRSRFDDAAVSPMPEPLEYHEGRRIFSDEFSNSDNKEWEQISGLWMMIDGGYMGVDPTNRSPFVALARFAEPERYVLRGRFKLDPVSHYMSMIILRASNDAANGYVIKNQFRQGSLVAFFENSALLKNRAWEERTMAQRRFPFQNNRWYSFAAVVTPNRIDYYVDEKLILSYAGEQTLPPGRIGIGGSSASPTYFDDIVVSALEE